MRVALASLLLLAAAVAGCTEDPAPSPSPVTGLELDTIVSGRFAISNTTDYSMVWVHNKGSAKASATWNLTGPGKSALPANWTVAFSKSSMSLEPNGAKRASGRGFQYADWDWALMTVKVPANTTAGSRTMELWAGSYMKPINVTVRSLQFPVAKVGTKAKTHIEGRLEATNEVFQPATDFDMEVGSSGTIPGFSFGHAGLAKNEEVRLRLPPALGYGYEDHELAGKVLLFTVKIIAGV